MDRDHHLPQIDEHATVIEAAPGEVWRALGRVVGSAFGRRARAVGGALGVRPLDPSGDPLTTGAALCGFRVVGTIPARELVLEGEHRFSRYALVFRIDPLADGDRVRLRAETRARFPGARGRLYRTLVIGTGGHAVVVRRLLRRTKGPRRALTPASPGARSRGGPNRVLRMPPTTHELGPDNATLQVKTYREGMVSKAGHDLVIDVTSWQATVTSDESSTPTNVDFSADPRSLRVRDGHGGAKPLSDKDKGDIAKNIDKKVLSGQSIDFRSTGVERPGGDGRLQVSGELKIGGAARSLGFDLTMAPDGRVEGTIPIKQSEWGIKPFTALMGALKVRDDIEVVLDARLPSG